MCKEAHNWQPKLTIHAESQWTQISNDILTVWKYCQLFTHELNTKIHSKTPFKLMGRKIPDTSSSRYGMWTPSNTPIPRPTSLSTPNGFQIRSAILSQYTLRTERQTDRRWARREVCANSRLRSIYRAFQKNGQPNLFFFVITSVRVHRFYSFFHCYNKKITAHKIQVISATSPLLWCHFT